MDEKLLNAIKEMAEGKESGFNVVYSETYNHVYFRAKQHMRDEEDALDLTQIVFVEAFKNINTLQAPEALYGWLDRITYYQGMKLFRKKKDVLLFEEGEGLFDTLESDDIESMPELSMDQKETSNIIRSIIDELPEAQKVALIAYYFDHFSVGQIAEMEECSEGTIKSRLNYARKYIKDRIEEKEKKEGYRIHVFTLPALLWAIKLMAEDTRMSEAAARSVYKGACGKLGLRPCHIIKPKAAGNATLAAGTKAVIIAGSMAVAGLGIGTGVYFAVNNKEAVTVISDCDLSIQQEQTLQAGINGGSYGNAQNQTSEAQEDSGKAGNSQEVETPQVENPQEVEIPEPIDVPAEIDFEAIAVSYAKMAESADPDDIEMARDYGFNKFYIDDINSDGIPEFFMPTPYSDEATKEYLIFSYRDGDIYQYGAVMGGHVHKLYGFYDSDDLIVEWIQSGYNGAGIASPAGGALTDIYEYEYSEEDDIVPTFKGMEGAYEMKAFSDLSVEGIRKELERFR